MTEPGTSTIEEKADALSATTDGAIFGRRQDILHLLEEREKDEKRQAQIQAVRLPLTACTYGGWLLALIMADKAASVWTIILTFALVQTIASLLGAQERTDLDIAPARSKPSDLNELSDWAIIALSLIILTTFSMFKIDLKAQPKIRKQVVEITLVSPSDAVNRQEMLPASETAVDTVKQKGELNNTMGSASPRAQSAEENQTDTPRETTKRPKDKPQAERKQSLIDPGTDNKEPEKQKFTLRTAQENFQFQAPSGWKTTTFAEPQSIQQQSQKSKQNTQQQMLSEVSPASFIESIDNEGENDHIVQSGGRSDSGRGQENDLRIYLKELNRRIKKHWLPPTGMEEVALIRFRVNPDGSLANVSAAPQNAAGPGPTFAAIQAVKKSFPFKALPSDYKSPYLEVRYTFNYRINQMNDIPFTAGPENNLQSQ